MKELPCWSIMNCEDQTCAARHQPTENCWEIARDSEDYRAEFNVCHDCLVSVLKTGSLPFSTNEISLMANGRSCPLACPHKK